jgi:CheY-like chemotaxis protein
MTQEVRTMRGFVVLVVDDDTDNLELAARIVESFGCSVLKASSCADALAVLDSGAHVDLVFSDVVMPESSGITLARLAHERNPGMPIVLATGFPDAIDDVTDSGAIPLIKPYTIARLEAVFAEQLRVDRGPLSS